MKIVITNIVVLNTGDAAILLGMIEILRKAFDANIDIVIYDSNYDAASKYYPELKFRQQLYKNITRVYPIRYIGRVLKLFKIILFYLAVWSLKNNLHFIAKLILNQEELNNLFEYINADLIISSGGTYLVENYSLESKIFDYQISLFLKKPLVFFTQSLGPFLTSRNQKAFKKIFEQSLLILLRDRHSEENILKINAQNANTFVSADAAFALANVSSIENAQNAQSFASSPKIAISVRDWKHFKTIDPALGRKKYLETVSNMTIHLVEKYGAKITYISTCQGIPEYWTDDSKVAFEIIKKLPTTVVNSVILDENFHSPEKLMEMLRSYDLVISTRLHMAILALNSGVPVLPIAYEFKTQELFKRIGQKTDWILDIEDINSKLAITAIDSFMASIADIRKTIFPNILKEHERALESGQLLKKIYNRTLS